MNELKVTDASAQVLEELLDRVRWGSVSINRKGLAQKLGLTPSQVSKCFKELEDKKLVFKSEGGHLFLNKELCG